MSESSSAAAAHSYASRSRALKFSFDARSKPLVGQALELEARLRKRWFRRKPKVSLAQMDQSLQERAAPDELKRLSQKFIQFYYNHGQAHQFFEALGRLYLDAAAKETENGDRQWFLLFQAIEALSIAIQKSSKALNISAQSVIVAIYRILGPKHYETAATEKEVHRVMLNMLNIKKDPNDLTGREHIIKLYLRGHRYYEALVQMAEYEKIMRVKSRPLYQQKQGELEFRKAGIFQSMIDFYYNVRAGKREENQSLVDMAKLNGFIARFNRDNRRFNITLLTGTTALALQRTISSMIQIANHFYMEAIRSEKFAPKFKAYYFIARNHQLIENPKHAIQALTEGLRELELLRIAPKQKAEEKIKLLEMLYRLYSERGLQRNAEEVQKQLAQIRREGGGEESPPQQKPSRVEEAGPAAEPSAPPAGEANPAVRDT
jgi:hypothetical protein